MTRSFTTALVSLAATFSLVAPTHAGTFEVPACDAADNHVNHSWDFENTNPVGLQRLTSCPSSTDNSGLVARTILGSATTTPVGGHAQWSFHAPTGLTITQLRMRRWLGMEAGSGWRLYGETGGGVTIPGETCAAGSGTDECNVGGVLSAEVTRAVNTTRLSYGFACAADEFGGTQCLNGSSFHWARAAIYSAQITLDDPTPPTITAPTGALVTEAGYHQGTDAATFSGGDTTGLKALRVYVDGALRASVARECDYTYTLPCNYLGRPADPASTTLSIDTTALADGAHTVAAAVVDAAGNETRAAARSIVIDNQGPIASLALDPRDESTSALSASFRPSGAQVAPVTEARWTLCPIGGIATCSTGTVAADNTGGRLNNLAIPGQGDWSLRLQLVDAAGNAGEAETATARFTIPAAPQPALTLRPQPTPAATPIPMRTTVPTPTAGTEPPAALRSASLELTATQLTSRRLTVRGTLARAATGRLMLRYRARANSRVVQRLVRVRSGHFAATFTLPESLRGATRGTVELRYAGDTVFAPRILRRSARA